MSVNGASTIAANAFVNPRIIQGGMGIGISSWTLARTVSRAGELGVVSGTGLNLSFALKLQRGDPGGHLRRAAASFPIPEIAAAILKTYLNDGDRSKPDKAVPMFTMRPGNDLLQLTVLANYCEVYLAKEGHEGLVGINLLEKVQLPNLASLYGAMLAGVDVVLMGAGIPREIPLALDNLHRHESASLRLTVDGALPSDNFTYEFDPKRVIGGDLPTLKRPKFFAIVSSDVLAKALLARSTGSIEGFVVEGHSAGGHNAPPRGGVKLDDMGEPIYGARDTVDLEKIKALGLPFWLAGSQAGPEQLQYALSVGASGVQVGTAFAFSNESGLEAGLKLSILEQIRNGDVRVFADPLASPTGFPFKVVQLSGTLSDEPEYSERERLCQIGYLRSLYKREDGLVGYRCPGEPVEDYVKKGGAAEDTLGKKCLCNALAANIGLPATQKSGYVEKPLITAGDTLLEIRRYFTDDTLHYSATAVIDHILGKPATHRDAAVSTNDVQVYEVA